MTGDDLTGLFTPPSPVEPWRQGTIVSFDPSDGSNTVRVGGTTLTDVNLLNIGDVTRLRAGDVVVLAKAGTSWAILGRIITPGSGAFAATALSFDGVGNSRLGFALSTGDAVLASGSVTVPGFANQAAVLATVNVSARNPTSAPDYLYTAAGINGVSGGTAFALAEAGDWESVAASAQRVFYVSGGATVTVDVRARANTAWATNGANQANVDALILFRKAPI